VEDEDHVCTYCLSGDTLIHQEIFTCQTCSSTGEVGEVKCFCAGCAATCHAEHDTQPIAFGQAYCDCGAAGCQLQQQTHARITSGAEDEEAVARALRYRGEERTALDIAEDRMPFSVHEVVPMAVSASPSNVFEKLRAECISVLKRSKDTFWVGGDWQYSQHDDDSKTDNEHSAAGERKQSLCQLEDFALMIFHYHTQTLASKGVEVDPSCSGAEWWIQVKNAYEGPTSEDAMPGKTNQDSTGRMKEKESDGDQTICLHYDKDEDAAEKWGVGLFPPLSTVTYLSEASAPSASHPTTVRPQPTLIFNATANDVVGAPINDVYLSFPRIGKHVAFDGNLLHGAPANPSLCTWRSPQPSASVQEGTPFKDSSSGKQGSESTLRVTFLVNIWLNHHPLGVHILDEDLARSSGGESGRRQVDASALIDPMTGLQVSFSPPPVPTTTSSATASFSMCGGDKEKEESTHDTDLRLPLTTLMSLQTHGNESVHTMVINSDDVFGHEREDERDDGVDDRDVLLCAGHEQLCLPFISSKQSDLVNENVQSNGRCVDKKGQEDKDEEEEEEEEEEADLIVRMILPPCPHDIPPNNLSHSNIPTDSFHFVYGDELCAPTLEYEYDDDYDEDRDTDMETDSR